LGGDSLAAGAAGFAAGAGCSLVAGAIDGLGFATAGFSFAAGCSLAIGSVGSTCSGSFACSFSFVAAGFGGLSGIVLLKSMRRMLARASADLYAKTPKGLLEQPLIHKEGLSKAV